MFNWFRNFKIRNKLITILLLMVVLSLTICLTALIVQNWMQTSIAHRLEMENKIVELNAQTENALLRARRAEKDYLLRYKLLGFTEARTQYANSVKENVQNILNYNSKIKELEVHEEHIEMSDTIARSILDYEKTFMNVVDLLEKRGFEDSGIEGNFRKKVHAIEEVVNKKGFESLIIDMLMMRRHEKDYLLRGDSKYITQLLQSIEHFKSDINEQTELEVVEKQQLKQLAEDYQVAFEQLVEIVKQVTDNIEIYRKVVHKIEPLFEEITLESKTHKQKVQIESEKSSNFMMTFIIISSIFAMVVNVAIAIFLANWISKPLRLIVQGSQLLTAGDTKLRGIDQEALKKITEYKDEIGEIANSFNILSSYFKEVISDLVNVSTGLAEGKLRVMPKALYHGDFHRIKLSLEKAVINLADATTKNVEQDWLKTGQTHLNKKISGELNIIQLAENIINFLTPYVEAQVGAFYLFESNGEKSGKLRMIASHAYIWRKNADNTFTLGEGIVGQAAFERKLFVITQTPENYIQIQSGLGESKPSAILVAPFLYENELRGVIELASFKIFTEIHLEFLKQAMSIIAVAVNTAESRTKMQILLVKTQVQSAELENKTAELQLQQEELHQTNEELQSQAEELQTQQEELRQTNEQLEVHLQNLEQQKEEVRLKNKVLEQTQTEMEKAKQAIENKAKELELASKYKSEFLANMSHELRTPLNSLLILAQILSENRTGNLTEKQVEYTRTIHSAGSDLLILINDILDLSKVEAGRVEVNVEPFALADLFEAIEQKFKLMADEKGLEFKLSIAPNVSGMLYSDVHRLQQILNNLLSNAFKFTHRGSVSLFVFRPTQDLSDIGLNAEEVIAFTVEDTGIGIPKDKQCAVFEAFQQADGTTSRKYGGTGLGLSISRQLARLLNGNLVLHSEDGKGSVFTLYVAEKMSKTEFELSPNIHKQIPTFQSNSHQLQATLNEKGTHSIENQRESNFESDEDNSVKATYPDDRENLQEKDKVILIIEDDRKFLNIMVNLVHEKGFKTIVAEDGVVGLQLAERYKPQAIVLDVGLPRMDGWNVMERLKDNPETRHIPVHFMSAADEKNQDAKKMGAVGYLLKPINMGELDSAFAKIERYIAKDVRQLLLITDNILRKQQILDLVQTKGVNVIIAANAHELHQTLLKNSFDCSILDISTENKSGINLLQQLAKDDKLSLSQAPVILYADRELTHEEEVALRRCEINLAIKSVHSLERLLDETTLFLHQLESELPEDKRKMLNLVHDREVILADKKVMIVDDDVRNTFALMSFLESKNMEVVVANNGKEALDLLQENPDIALILMDIMMPEMDGYETMRKIKEQVKFRKLPIIALTAKAMKGDKSKCIEAGANDYVSKPVDTDKLLSLMRVWLYG